MSLGFKRLNVNWYNERGSTCDAAQSSARTEYKEENKEEEKKVQLFCLSIVTNMILFWGFSSAVCS